jgi:hypothetical protein
MTELCEALLTYHSCFVFDRSCLQFLAHRLPVLNHFAVLNSVRKDWDCISYKATATYFHILYQLIFNSF